MPPNSCVFRAWRVPMSAIHILLVDDDPFVRDVVTTALGNVADVDVTSCGSARAAITAAQAQAPDLAVLDVMMPEMDGLELHARLTSVLSPMPPVVFLTGREDAALMDKLRAVGAAAVLAKPFDARNIANDILQAVRGRAAARSDPRLTAVAAHFRASLSDTSVDIARDWDALAAQWQAETAERLFTRLHRLAGSAGLFGLNALGDAARTAEADLQALIQMQADGAEQGGAGLDAVADSLARLRRAMVPDV